MACGSSLTVTRAATGEERKVVSVLFVDLVGFTARSDRADPEDVRATLRPYHSMLKREIERFGGTVEKFIGDAVMAVFGAPVAHEDDAERAVRSALRIVEALPELNEELDLDLAVRAAVNTGEAVVALGARPEAGEGIVSGDVVNTASRMQQIASTGGIVVGEITYRSTRHVIDYEPLEAVTVKGKAEPVSLWRALRARSTYAVEIERPRTRFVGREAEMALLQQTFARAIQEPSVQLVTVTGEPGVGKSRLIAELFGYVDALPELVSWRQGRCLPYGEGITFWALGEIVKAQAGILESDSPDEAAARLSQAVETVMEGPEREWVRARLAPLVGVEAAGRPIADPVESFAAWRTFLEAMATSGPFVAVIEDLHWADPAFLDFLDHLVDWASGVPLLLVCTARPELYERVPGWGGGKRNSATISLPSLTDEQTAILIGFLLDQAALPAETQAAILERAGGNPLYTEEFVRMLIDRGFLERRGAVWRLTAEEVPLPETIQALVAARLDTLPAHRKALLHDASVVGKVFWSGAVAAMGGIDESAARDGLHELVRKELIRPVRRSSVEGQAEYSFWHILGRDVAYSQIPRASRASKHRAAAEWLESIAEERVGDHAEILAHHYGQALELARATGAIDEYPLLEERAARFLEMAGDRAMHLDVSKADEYYRQALDLLPAGHPDRDRVLLRTGHAAYQQGLYEEAQRDIEEAIRGCRGRGDTRGAGDALAKLPRVLWIRGDTAGALAAAREAIDVLERDAPGPELVEPYNEVARLYMLAGRGREGVEWADKAIDLGRRFDLDAQVVMALATRGPARFDLRDVGGVGDLREALHVGQRLGLGFETARTFGNLKHVLQWTEGSDAALETCLEGIQFAERRGLTHIAMWMSVDLIVLRYEVGEWDQALGTAEQLLEWSESRGRSQILVGARDGQGAGPGGTR